MDPLSNIEDRKAQNDLGIIAHRIFEGARGDGASRLTAYMIVAAWFRAAFESSQEAPEE